MYPYLTPDAGMEQPLSVFSPMAIEMLNTHRYVALQNLSAKAAVKRKHHDKVVRHEEGNLVMYMPGTVMYATIIRRLLSAQGRLESAFKVEARIENAIQTRAYLLKVPAHSE